MELVRLDCKGLSCPQPVLQTKEALEQGAELIEIILDNEASKNNVARFGLNQGCEVEITSLANDCFLVNISRALDNELSPAASAECALAAPAETGLIYVISSDSMGRGSDELGWALMQTYIQTIKDVTPLPDKILFYNAGVKLVAEGSGALDALVRLQEQGVAILACGTCLDYFKLKSALKVGEISNMYDIMNAMNKAAKVVSPY